MASASACVSTTAAMSTAAAMLRERRHSAKRE